MRLRCPNCGREISSSGRRCICMLETNTKVQMPSVKEPKTSVGSLTVDVGINGMDETIKQLQALKRLYTDIDTLQQRIIKGAERVEQIAKRCCKAQEEFGGRPAQSYMEYMESRKI